MKSPFPYFGSKSKIAGVVWDAFGAVRGYFEPFAGSLAVLLEADRNDNRYEVVNDADHYIVNFWWSLKNDPEETARWANNLNSEADLFARHLWLVNEGKNRLDRIEADPDYYDPKVAGWWVWGAANWIGSGWCFGGGPWKVIDGKVVKDSTGQGITRRLLDLDNRGINRKLLHLDNRGINRKRLNLGNTGQGINRKLLHLGGEGAGVDLGLQPITDYFNQLAERLRYVRICCGDFERIITIGAM
jgi:DNA adenine methylase